MSFSLNIITILYTSQCPYNSDLYLSIHKHSKQSKRRVIEREQEHEKNATRFCAESPVHPIFPALMRFIFRSNLNATVGWHPQDHDQSSVRERFFDRTSSSKSCVPRTVTKTSTIQSIYIYTQHISIVAAIIISSKST